MMKMVVMMMMVMMMMVMMMVMIEVMVAAQETINTCDGRTMLTQVVEVTRPNEGSQGYQGHLMQYLHGFDY